MKSILANCASGTENAKHAKAIHIFPGVAVLQKNRQPLAIASEPSKQLSNVSIESLYRIPNVKAVIPAVLLIKS